MKFVIVLASLSVIVMLAMIYLAVDQEFKLRDMKTHIVESYAEVRMKEGSIVELKTKDKTLKTELVSFNSKLDGLKKRKEESEKSAKDLTQTLQTCTTETENLQKKKASIGEAIAKVKADHGVAKNTAEEDIKNLKKQILERDTAICVFANTSTEEARKLCGIPEAPK